MKNGMKTGKKALSTHLHVSHGVLRMNSGLIQMCGLQTMFKRGDQVLYAPEHVLRQYQLGSSNFSVKDLIGHPDIEFGFITSVSGNVAFCRFWSKANNFTDLRTNGNSEFVFQSRLFLYDLKPQEIINEFLNNLK